MGDYFMSNENHQKKFYDFEVPDKGRIDKVYKIAKRFFKNYKGTCLEIGACRGGLAEKIAKKGWDCTGIDINPRQINNVKMIQKDINNGYGIHQKFDLIFAGEVIEHIFNDRKFLKETHEHLKDNGLFVLTTPNLHYTLNRLLILLGFEPTVFAEYHYHVYSIKEMKKLLYAAGFKVIGVSSSHVLISSRKHKYIGKFFEKLGDLFPSFGMAMIIAAVKR